MTLCFVFLMYMTFLVLPTCSISEYSKYRYEFFYSFWICILYANLYYLCFLKYICFIHGDHFVQDYFIPNFFILCEYIYLFGKCLWLLFSLKVIAKYSSEKYLPFVCSSVVLNIFAFEIWYLFFLFSLFHVFIVLLSH